MPAETLIHNARLLIFGGVPADGWLLVRDGRIADLGRGAPPATDGQRLDAQGAILAPGLVDLHVHGALGHDTMDATPEALGVIARFQVEHGVTSFLATTMSRPTDEVLAALRVIAAV
ncbi:MAG: N-acetylglucosamine-6-phosphate deacetylase, partial [Chloroflexota bacterium]